MIKIRKHPVTLTLLAALALSACQPEPMLRADSGATFGIYPVLHNADGSRSMTLPANLSWGEDVQEYVDDAGRPVFVTQPAIVDESCLDAISAEQMESSGPVLVFKLDERCARIFGSYTAKNIGKQMALMLNGEFISAPHIRAAITAGTGSIDGSFSSLAEAEAIAKTFY